MCLCIQDHKLLRNQSIVGSKLPDLSEAAEQEKGDSLCLASCPCKIESILSSPFSNVPKSVHFLNLRENLFKPENYDDLCLFFPSYHPFTGNLITEK